MAWDKGEVCLAILDGSCKQTCEVNALAAPFWLRGFKMSLSYVDEGVR